MKCPNCENEMTQGTVQVQCGSDGFAAGEIVNEMTFSHELYFEKNDNRNVLMLTNEKRVAFRCSDCLGFFVTSENPCSIDPVTGVVTEYED